VVLWFTTLFSDVVVYQRFGGPFCLHLQGGVIGHLLILHIFPCSSASYWPGGDSNHSRTSFLTSMSASKPQSRRPEDGCSKILRNAGIITHHYTASQHSVTEVAYVNVLNNTCIKVTYFDKISMKMMMVMIIITTVPIIPITYVPSKALSNLMLSPRPLVLVQFTMRCVYVDSKQTLRVLYFALLNLIYAKPGPNLTNFLVVYFLQLQYFSVLWMRN